MKVHEGQGREGCPCSSERAQILLDGVSAPHAKTIVAVQNREQGKKGFWTDIGEATVLPSGITELTFDVVPVAANITVQIRDRRRPNESSPPVPAEPPPTKHMFAIITRGKGKQATSQEVRIGLDFGKGWLIDPAP